MKNYLQPVFSVKQTAEIRVDNNLHVIHYSVHTFQCRDIDGFYQFINAIYKNLVDMDSGQMKTSKPKLLTIETRNS